MAHFGPVVVVGVGLIGGSLGMAVRERKLAAEVIGVGRNPQRLRRAQEQGALDHYSTDLGEAVAEAQLIVVCTPVDSVAEHLCRAAESAPRKALLTDAGSTKSEIVARVEELLQSRPAGPSFVGSHPLAGDHRTGCDYARGDLFAGRTVVVTPTECTPPGTAEQVGSFWQAIGAEVVSMTPTEHDRALAYTSHLPHLVSAALAATTPQELLPLAAGGWQDTTRVAAGDAELWRQIFASNRHEVMLALQQFELSLSALRRALSDGDDEQLQQLLEHARQVRNALGS